MAMGYVEGESLAERVKRAGPLSIKEAVRLLQDTGYALAYAHGRGVVHRDIKPDNIMLERATGRALVMDFGISRTISNAPVADTGLTRVGEVVGTPEFMSPEQASGDRVDGRSDLYSLGLVAWYAVTGQLAISGETTQKVLVKQLTETLPPIVSARADLPTPLPVRLFQQSGKSYLTNAGLVILVAAVNVFRSETEAQLDKLATLSAVLEEGDEARAQSLRRNDRDHRHLHDVHRVADPHP